MQLAFQIHLYQSKNTTMKQLLFTGAVLILLFTACGGNKEIVMDDKPFYETNWLLRKVVINNVTEDVNTKAFMKFVEAQQSAGGNGSCNSFGSTATISGRNVSIKNIISTKMFCEEVQKIENAFFIQLEKSIRYEIKGNKLMLYQGNDMVLEFVAE